MADGRLTTPDQWADHWEGVKLPYLIDLRSYRWQAYDRLLRRVLAGCEGKALEVGSGACQWLIYLHREFGFEVFGLDDSIAACRVGHRNLGVAGVQASVICGDLFAAPVREATFDLVYSDGVIEHFDDFRLALAPMLRLVRPGGLVVATVPNFGGWFGTYRRIFDPDLYRIHKAVNGADLQSAFEELGLNTIEVGYFASLRIPYGKLFKGRGWRAWVGLAPRVLARIVDKFLVSAYRLTGRSIESSWLSAEIFAVGRRSMGPIPQPAMSSVASSGGLG
jgi:SAM-dependent methyltransferase